MSSRALVLASLVPLLSDRTSTGEGQPLGVRSETGLGLPFVELSLDGETWTRCAVEDEVVSGSSRPAGELLLRAPGHSMVRVPGDKDEAVLVPECTLRVDTQDEPGAWVRLEQEIVSDAGCHGWAEPTSWVLTVHPEAVEKGEVRILVGDAEGPLARVRFRARKGAALSLSWLDLWSAEVPIVFERGWGEAPVQEPGRHGARSVTSGRPDVRIRTGPLDVVLEPEPDVAFEPVTRLVWGGRIETLRRGSASMPDAQRRKCGSRAPGWTSKRVPLGLRYRVEVKDVRSQYAGERTFVHDGASRTVALEPGLSVVGRLVPPERLTVPRRMSVTLRRDDPTRADVEPWVVSYDDMMPTQEGRFELPAPLPPRGTSERDARPRLVVDLSVGGYEPFQHEVRLDGAKVQDLGGVHLVPLEPDAVLEGCWGDVDLLGPNQSTFRLDNAPGLSWFVRAWRWEVRHKSASAFLDRVGETDRYRAREDATGAVVERPFPLGRTEAVLLEVGERNPWGAFESIGRRIFRRIEESYDLVYDCREIPPGALAWWIGFTWRGIHQPLVRVDEERRGSRTTFLAPPEGVTVWWSTTPHPPSSDDEGGSREVTPRDPVRLVLQ